MSMSNDEARTWLTSAWNDAINQTDSADDVDFDWIFDTGNVSMRYATLTQLLGKHADERRDTLCLQLGDRSGEPIEEGRWDPRSFCVTAIVPWVQSADNVIGTSTDPYVSKPLRRTRLDVSMSSLQRKGDWERIIEMLALVQERDNPEFTAQMLQRCLMSIARHYRAISISYPVPTRISMNETTRLLAEFLAEQSGGERPMLVATALLRVLGRRLNLFTEVRRQSVNEADAASNVPGDIVCLRDIEGADPEIVLVVEVKDRRLSLVETNATIEKARRSQISEVLFTTRGRDESESDEISQRVREEWALGTNIYEIPLLDLIRVTLPLMGEASRPDLLREIGYEINDLAQHPSLRAVWGKLLQEV